MAIAELAGQVGQQRKGIFRVIELTITTF